jgi:dTMP kinase
MSKNSLFIVIEGLDGSGKTTAGRRLTEVLNNTFQNKTKLTYEPHDPSCGGLFIRQVLTKKIKKFDHHVLALSYAANRLDHCCREIEPWLERDDGRIVISDRYYLSSLVYQSRPDFSFEEIMKLNNKAIKPDLIFFLNVSNEVCYERMNIRNQPRELFEGNLSETREKYFKAIEYLKEEHGDNIVEIDGGGTIEQTVSALLKELESYFPKLKFINYSEKIQATQLYGDFEIDEMSVFKNSSQTPAYQNIISKLTFPQKGGLFLKYLDDLGFAVGKKILTAHLNAFELEFFLPGDIKQRGTALLLNNPHQINQVLKLAPNLAGLSDFMFVFSPGPPELANEYFERDRIEFSNQNNETANALFPSLKLVNEKDLAEHFSNKS